MLATLKEKLLKYINSKGYRIDKIITPKKFKEGSSTKIEFFGVSGVGKSFLYNKVCEQLSSKNQFIFENEMELYKNIDNYRSIDLINKSYDLLRKILFEYSFEIENYYDRLGFLSFSQRMLKKEESIKTINKKAYILIEEGVFHFPNVLKKLFEEKKEYYSQVVDNTVLIYCYTTAENIIKRKNKRIEEKQRSYLDLGNKNHINKQLLDYQIFLNVLESESPNLKILRVDTSLDVNTNVKKILDFLRNYK